MPRRTDIQKIMIIGSGPIVIGQACEFDYSGVQACKALREDGFEVVLVNSNPATIMTDPEFADRTYIEPLDVDVLTSIISRERPDALLPTLGGQTALNLAMDLDAAGVPERFGVEILGARADVIRKAEERVQAAVQEAPPQGKSSRHLGPSLTFPSVVSSLFFDLSDPTHSDFIHQLIL